MAQQFDIADRWRVSSYLAVPEPLGLQRTTNQEGEKAPGRPSQVGVKRRHSCTKPGVESVRAGGLAGAITAHKGNYDSATAWSHPAIGQHGTEQGGQQLLSAGGKQSSNRWWA
jgi:hypothetical protein